MLVVLLGAVVGGRRAGVTSAVVAALSLDFFHTQPYNSLKVSHSQDVQSMLLFLAVALAVAAPFSYELPVMEASGVVASSLHRFTREGFELPHERLALRVVTGGRTVGRFVLAPTPGAGVSMDRRRVAVALVDQLGVVLSRAS